MGYFKELFSKLFGGSQSSNVVKQQEEIKPEPVQKVKKVVPSYEEGTILSLVQDVMQHNMGYLHNPSNIHNWSGWDDKFKLG